MRRVLLISYYFPPSGGSGVQRALKFARYLPEMGWQPVILTVDPEQAAFPEFDKTLLDEIPDGMRVERTPVWDPYELYARFLGREKQSTVFTGLESGTGWKHHVSRWIRANIFLPDARVGWVPHAVRRARHLMGYDIDAVMTTGPPHSTHLIGLYLQQRFDLPWLADFRDPWTGIDYYEELPMSLLAKWLDAKLERRVLQRADVVTVVTPTMERSFGQQLHGRLAMVQNGFDPADFENSDTTPETSSTFQVAHLGNMNEARDPTALWQAIDKLGQRIPEITVELAGSIDTSVLNSARRHGVIDRVKTPGYLSHAEAVRRMRTSTLLLLVINRVKTAKGIVTGKLYEYIASGRPILGLGPPDGDAADILRSSGAGTMFAHDDTEGVAHMLERHYQAWTSHSALDGASIEEARPYSRREQTRKLADLLQRELE